MTADFDDLDTFFSEDDFATSAMYYPSGGVAKSILVIVDSVPVDSSVTNVIYSNQHVTAICKTTDMPEATNGDVLVINAVAYNVIYVDVNLADGTTTLVLSKD